MKLKAVLFKTSPVTLLNALNKIRQEALARVLVPHLHVPPDFGPADFYVQVCDEAEKDASQSPTDHMCVVGLSNVSGPSTARKRSYDSYFEAQQALFQLYLEKLKLHIPEGHRTQLYASIALDQAIPDNAGRMSSLVESPTLWVPGEQKGTGVVPQWLVQAIAPKS